MITKTKIEELLNKNNIILSGYLVNKNPNMDYEALKKREERAARQENRELQHYLIRLIRGNIKEEIIGSVLIKRGSSLGRKHNQAIKILERYFQIIKNTFDHLMDNQFYLWAEVLGCSNHIDVSQLSRRFEYKRRIALQLSGIFGEDVLREFFNE